MVTKKQRRLLKRLFIGIIKKLNKLVDFIYIKRVIFLGNERKRRRKKRRNILPLVVEAVIAVVVCFLIFKAAVFGYSFARDYFSKPSEAALTGETVEITIPEGASTKKIAEILKENGLIHNTLAFRLESKSEGYDGSYMQGTYEIEVGTDIESIMKQLQSGVVFANADKLTVPEGYTVKQIADLVEKTGIDTADGFITEVNTGEFNYDFLSDTQDRPYRLEGYLFPATYDIKEGTTSHDIIVMMLDRFEIAYDNILSAYSGEYTTDQLVTIASLVQSEIQLDSERKTAAGVIYNRIAQNMPLQIDSTVQYALSTRNEVVTYTDTEVDSPYNTYKYKGLPLGPICCPGEPSLEAAVNPESNNYIYYVLKQRGSGEHVFTENYDDFLKAKEEYKNSFN